MENLLEMLSKEELSLGKRVNLKKGEVLFHEGEECSSIGIVSIGQISIISNSYHGKEVYFISLLPGESFGHNLLFSKDKRYRGDVKADVASSLYLFGKKNLLHLLETNERFLESYLSRQAEAGKALNQRLMLLSFPTLEERLFFALHLNGGNLRYKSVSNLSKTLGSERETLSRLLSKLEREGKLIREGRTIRENL